MRLRTLHLLCFLALTALPAWSAPHATPEPSPAAPVTLADILAPAPSQPETAGDLDAFDPMNGAQERVSCSPTCTSSTTCWSFCGCTLASCKQFFYCPQKICDCTMCP